MYKRQDLTRQDAVEEFFAQEKPEYVFLAAAKVGGIVANQEALADCMYENMTLEMNVIHSAWKNGCKKLEFLGSSCIYPRMAPQPMKESCLLTSELEKTNEAYALAKISGLKYCEFLNRQYGTDYISVMPTNLYGPNDNYHPTHSHVVPALIRRFHEAKVNGVESVTCWGDGSPLREFLYVDDLANLCVFLMNNYSGDETVNCLLYTSGSAWHVGMAAQYVLEDMADVPVRVELASEFRYRKMPLNQKALVIVVSQSGETADTLAALRLAKEKGITTMAIVNVAGSSIAREADKVFYTLAGPEISVATTKAYSAQLAAMYCLAVRFAKVREKITEEQYSYYISELLTLPEKMQKTLEDKERIQWFAAKYANAHDVFFVGRGIDYAVCLEGSLKLKEISYIHSEAYAAGELKHGTISLIEQGTLVIGALTQSELYEKTISNMLECKSRGAYLMGLTTYGKYEIEDQVNFTVYVPKVDEHFVGSLAVIPLQLLGYYVSVAKGLDVDKPRNLAKSVTVE